jgi:diguanylate cyclase (GGDEF)-like protein
MSQPPTHGNVLVLADDPAAAERLCRWIAEAGEQPWSPAEPGLPGALDGQEIDLVVSELDPGAAASRALLDRLLDGEVLFGVPQIHRVRDEPTCALLRGRSPDAATVALLPAADPEQFRAQVRLAAEAGRLRAELPRVSLRDPLTGAFNRRFVTLRLDQEFARARRHRTPLSVVVFDVDELGAINQRHGLAAGDRIIRGVHRLLEEHMRRDNVHGRWGGDSFAVILAGTPPRGAAVFANKVRGDTAALRQSDEENGAHATLSAGISSHDAAGPLLGASDLANAAEQALAEAKRRGGNRVFIDEAALHADRRLVLVADPDRELLDLAEDLLSLADLRVIRAESPEALRETLRLRKPDVLIAELALLEAAGGTALIEELRSRFPDPRLPVVGLAAAPGLAPPPGVDLFLSKPFSVGVLCSVANDLLERRQQV